MYAKKEPTHRRKEQIARVTLQLMGTYGLKRLSVARIAREIGLVPSAIYRHFGSKEEIIDAVLTLLHNRLLANVEEACAESKNALDCLHEILMRHIQLFLKYEAIPRVVFSQAIDSENPERKEKVCRIVSDYIEKLKKIIKQGKKQGCIRSDVDSQTIALMFLGIIQPPAILRSVANGKFNLELHAKKGWKLFSQTIGLNRIR